MKKSQSFNCDLPIESLEYWGGTDIVLPKNSVYTLVIDYPFNKAGYFKIKTDTCTNLGLVGLLRRIYKCYKKQYQMAERDNENGYWHGIEDLVIETIKVNHKTKIIKLDIGS